MGNSVMGGVGSPVFSLLQSLLRIKANSNCSADRPWAASNLGLHILLYKPSRPYQAKTQHIEVEISLLLEKGFNIHDI
jgi:hypothetical protein